VFISGPRLSVIVTSYTLERLKNVYELLDTIKAQTYENVETIFVAERSLELVEKIEWYTAKKNIKNVGIIFNHGEPGATNARNLGIREATGDVLAFVDDDVILFPDWAEEMVKTYQDQSVAGVTGPIFPLWEDESMSWFPQELDWMLGCTMWLDIKDKTEVRSINGANASFRRKALDLAGSYSKVLGPTAERHEWDALAEETELSLRVVRKTGKRIVYNPQVRVYHKVTRRKLRLSFIVQRCYQVGHTKRMLKRLYATSDRKRDLLTTERKLLRRILSRLPQLSIESFHNPVTTLRRFLLTIVSLFFVALGYYSY